MVPLVAQAWQLRCLLVLASLLFSLVLSHGSTSQCQGSHKVLMGGTSILDATACSTNRALGYAIGRQFKESIAMRIAALGPQLEKAIAYTRSGKGQAAVAALVKASSEAYPQYWEELEGIVEGSGVPKDLIIMLNFRQELSILAEGANSTLGADDCSDVMLQMPDKQQAFLGHNEDNTADTVNTTYFVQAKLNGRSWTAYTYAGELSSAAWGFSDAGVSFTLNAVYAKEVNVPGVGRNFVSRSILDAATLEDAIKRITVPNQATGHNINVIGLDDQRIMTIETGPGNTTDIKEIKSGSYFHANAYLRLDIPQVPGPSSEHRQARAAELPEPRNREDILRILGDTKDPKYPIYRSGTDSVWTLCTAFFDLQAETVEVFFANPKQDLASDSLQFQLRSNYALARGTRSA